MLTFLQSSIYADLFNRCFCVIVILFFLVPTSVSHHCRFERTRSHTFTSSPSISPFTVARPHGLVRHGAMRVVRQQMAGSLEVFFFFFLSCQINKPPNMITPQLLTRIG